MAHRSPRALPPLVDVVIDAPPSALRRNGKRVVDTTRIVAVRPKAWKGKPGPMVTREIMSDLTWHLRTADREHFLVVLCDERRRLIGIYDAFRGGPSHVETHPAQVLKMVLLTGAPLVILVHNHPTGRTRASEPDKTTTVMFARLLRAFGASLFAHYIVGADGMTEFGEPLEERHIPTMKAPRWVTEVPVDGDGFPGVGTLDEALGPYKKFLVAAGLVRKPHAGRMRLGHTGAASLLTRDLFALHDDTPPFGVAYSVDADLSVLAAELVSDADVASGEPMPIDTFGKAAVLLGLLTGGSGVVLVFDHRNDGLYSEGDRMADMRAMVSFWKRRDRAAGIPQLLDVVSLGPQTAELDAISALGRDLLLGSSALSPGSPSR